MADERETQADGDGEADPVLETTIGVFGRETEDEEDGPLGDEDYRIFGSGKKPSEITYVDGEVRVSVLQARIQGFLSQMDRVLTESPPTVGGFKVDSITISVEINAKGGVRLLGVGGETGAKAGLSFTLKR
jgi:hypothetical protein